MKRAALSFCVRLVLVEARPICVDGPLPCGLQTPLSDRDVVEEKRYVAT